MSFQSFFVNRNNFVFSDRMCCISRLNFLSVRFITFGKPTYTVIPKRNSGGLVLSGQPWFMMVKLNP